MPIVQVVQVPQVQIIEKIVETLEIHSVQGARTSEGLGTATVCQMKPSPCELCGARATTPCLIFSSNVCDDTRD